MDEHELFAGLVEQSPNALVMTANDGSVLFWNRAAEGIFGYQRAEALGHRLDKLVGVEEASTHDPASHSDPATGTSSRSEVLRRCRDGALIYVNVSSREVRDGDGTPHGQVYSIEDVTHAKVMRDVQWIEARYRPLLESLPDAIVMVNRSGHVLMVNRLAETMFGYGHGELLGARVETLLPERLREVHTAHRRGYFDDASSRPMGAGLALQGRRHNGDEFPVEVSLSPLATEVGAVVMSAVRDISRRRREEQKFRGLLESAPDAMVIVDREGCIVLVNSQAERLFGYARADMLGRTIEMFVPQRFQAHHPDLRARYAADPKFRPMGAGVVLHGLRQDGSEFPVEISLSPIETEEGTLVSAAIRDISERRRVERALQDQNVELERALKAKDRFLATMSHELRTPLNAIIGFTGVILMKLSGPLTASQEKQLGMVQSSARHLLSLINDLLDLAKIESGKAQLHPVALVCQELIDEVVSTLRPSAEAKGLRLDQTLPVDPLVLSCDRRTLQQILINLVNNGIKFTDRGSLHITLERQAIERRAWVRLAVRDTGVGISAQDQARLFEAFSQVGDPAAASHQMGTGLGLYLCRKLAELLGGRLEMSSEAGQGSEFVLWLPQEASP